MSHERELQRLRAFYQARTVEWTAQDTSKSLSLYAAREEAEMAQARAADAVSLRGPMPLSPLPTAHCPPAPLPSRPLQTAPAAVPSTTWFPLPPRECRRGI